MKDLKIWWQCTVCGFLYKPEDGDPYKGVEPDTKFEDLPETWECMVCSAKKESFGPKT